MKVYIIMHKAARRTINTSAFVDVDTLGNGIYVKSVRAFLKKKHAKEFLEEQCLDNLEIVTAKTIN